MFYSHLLLSKKGALGIIWIAAHCHNKLKKSQIYQTNIISSVDKILNDEVPVVTHRILAFLLLGVVRIYSKKVDYLADDCRDVLAKIGNTPKGKKVKLSIEVLRGPYHSIAIPERFELDAFNLEGLEDQDFGSDRSVRSCEEIMLSDTRIGKGTAHSPYNKYYEENFSHSEVHSTSYTPVRDVLSPHFMDIDIDGSPSSNRRNLRMGLPIIDESRFLLDERLEPMTFGEAEDEGTLGGQLKKDFHTDGEQMNSMEKFHEIRFCLEERLEPLTFNEAEEQPGLDGLPNKDFPHDGKQMHNGTGISFREELAPTFGLTDNEKHMEAEMPMSESRMCQAPIERPVPITVDVTPQSKFSASSGDVVSEAMAVRTPAAKEGVRTSKKRSCRCDEQIVVPNEMLKHWINNSSDLVCKRRKTPHTALRVWEVQMISRLPESLLEPLIPSSSMDFRYLILEKAHGSGEHNQTAPSLPEEHTQTAPSFIDKQNPSASSLLKEQSKTVPSLSEERNQAASSISEIQNQIAPSTPIASSTFSEAPRFEVLEPATPIGSVEKGRSLSGDEALEFSLTDEEISSFEGDGSEKYELSGRTRKVAGYLYRKFAQKRRGEEKTVVKLSQVVKAKTKKESARLFYEILVLKTRDYVDVLQKSAYDDIHVLQTTGLKRAFEPADDLSSD